MKKKLFLSIIIMSILYLIIQFSLSKYNYKISVEAFEFTRDTSLPIVNISYSTEEPTNRPVTVTIQVDKEVLAVDGFIWNKEKKTLTKIVTENEENKIVLEDLSGNKLEVSYKVDWIDKIKPEILGIENGKTYNAPVDILYKDNVGIKSVEVQNYGYLELEFNGISHDTEKKYAFDYTDSTCRLRVIQKPRETVKFRYYCNDIFCIETTEEEYTYKNLEKDIEGIKFTVEAIDKNGNVIERREEKGRTANYKNVSVNKNNLGATVALSGIDSKVRSVRYYIWERGKQDSTQVGYETLVNNSSANLSFKISDFNNKKCVYTMHIYTVDFDGTLSLVNGIDIEIGKNYNPDLEEKVEIIEKPTNVNRLEQKGRYIIKAIDLAGNETEYIIRIDN